MKVILNNKLYILSLAICLLCFGHDFTSWPFYHEEIFLQLSTCFHVVLEKILTETVTMAVKTAIKRKVKMFKKCMLDRFCS